MKKVLLLSCFLSLTAFAGTGGGTSTPPARAGLAKLLAIALGIGADATDGALLLNSESPLPMELTVTVDTPLNISMQQLTLQTVVLVNTKGESRSYRIETGDDLCSLHLLDRRERIRNATHR